MKIKEKTDGNSVTFCVEGNLNTTTAPLLEERLGIVTADTTEVVFDFSKLDYISSAGLRTMMLVCKRIGSDGIVKVKDANEMIQDVLYTTGFSEVIVLE